MHKTRRMLTILLAVIGLLGLTTAIASAQDPEQGQTTWEESLCQRCHGEAGEGRWAGPLAGDDELSAEAWIEQVRMGGRRMPHFTESQLSDQAIRDMHAYITSLERVTANNIQRPDLDPEAHPGQVLIADKRCIACHGPNGPIGGFNRRAQPPTPELIVAQLRQPRNRMPAYSEDQVSQEEAAEIAAFLAEQYAPQVQPVPSPLDKALTAIGGTAALTGLQTLSIEATGRLWPLPEGEAAGGEPASPVVFTSTTSYDLAGDRLRIEISRESAGQPAQSMAIISGTIGYLDEAEDVVSEPISQTMSAAQRAETIRQQWLLNPQLILAEALADPSLVSDVGEVLWQGAVYHRLDVATEGVSVTLFIDVESGRIARVATSAAEATPAGPAWEAFFYHWQPIGQAGLAFPAEVYLAADGQIVRKEIRTAIDTNPDLEATLFDMPNTP